MCIGRIRKFEKENMSRTHILNNDEERKILLAIGVHFDARSMTLMTQTYLRSIPIIDLYQN